MSSSAWSSAARRCLSVARIPGLRSARQLRAAVPTWRVMVEPRASRPRPHGHTYLLQLGVFRFGFFQDGNIRVGLFPECEEILVGGAGAGIVAGERPGPPYLQMSQRASR